MPRLLAVQQRFSDKFNRTAFYVSRETFWWIAKFWKKIRFSFLRLVFNFGSFQGGFVGKYLTLLFASPDELIEKLHFISEKFRPMPFRDPNEKSVSLPEKLFKLVVKTALYISRGSFWKERMDLKFYTLYYLRILKKNFQPVRNNFRQWRKNCLLCVHRNILRKSVFWKKSSSNFLGL